MTKVSGGYILRIANLRQKMRILKSHSAEKLERGWIAMALYFMLEALDAFKIKYQVHLIKVHSAQKVEHTR